MCNIGSEDDDGNAASQPVKVVSAEKRKPLLEKGTDNWKNVVNALLKGTGTMEQVKSKYTVLEMHENELLELMKIKTV